MRAILLIYKRDIRALLLSPVFFVLSGLCAAIWSGAFLRTFFAFVEKSMLSQQISGRPSGNLHMEVILSHLTWVNILLMFIVPVLTMKLLSEEKRQGTYDLLLTVPISSTQIAVGKYLAGFVGALGLIFISFLYPLGLSLVVDVQMGPLLSAYLGLVFIGSVYVGIGIFCSSLARSAVISAVLAIVMNLSIFLTSGLSNLVKGDGLSSYLKQLELVTHYWQFLKGVASSSSIIFFISVIVFFIFSTQRVIEFTRWR